MLRIKARFVKRLIRLNRAPERGLITSSTKGVWETDPIVKAVLLMEPGEKDSAFAEVELRRQ